MSTIFIIPTADVECTADEVEKVFAGMDIAVQEVKSRIILNRRGEPFKRFVVTTYPGERKAGYLSTHIEKYGAMNTGNVSWKIMNI